MKILTKPLPNDQGLAFPNPLSTNHIVWALYMRAQGHSRAVKNRVLTGCILKIILENNFQYLVTFWKCYFSTNFSHFRSFQTNFGSVWIELILTKTENWNWKHCSKIIFKCVNSVVGPIFNEKVAEKWYLWVLWTMHGTHWCDKGTKKQEKLLSPTAADKKKKKRRERNSQNATHVLVLSKHIFYITKSTTTHTSAPIENPPPSTHQHP